MFLAVQCRPLASSRIHSHPFSSPALCSSPPSANALVGCTSMARERDFVGTVSRLSSSARSLRAAAASIARPDTHASRAAKLIYNFGHGRLGRDCRLATGRLGTAQLRLRGHWGAGRGVIGPRSSFGAAGRLRNHHHHSGALAAASVDFGCLHRITCARASRWPRRSDGQLGISAILVPPCPSLSRYQSPSSSKRHAKTCAAVNRTAVAARYF